MPRNADHRIDLGEAAHFLGITPHALERWIRQGTIPCRQSDGEIVFSKPQLKAWASSHNINWQEDAKPPASVDPQAVSLAGAMMAGGFYHNIIGNDKPVILKNIVSTIHLPEEVDRELLLKRLIEREQLSSTGLGHGIAVPHPRTPLKSGVESPIVSTCFLDAPVDYDTIDGKPVFVLFLMVSPNTKVHLQLLARLGFCLRDDGFIDFLRKQPDSDALCRRVEQVEKRMEKARGA
ncbi:MAG: excisionase [Candidatus Omnitrophota bacterium]|jgi:PTS system nitrogen regulatory IIA component|nr:MAG: excisionase [Candidatus Omnitrophota bacterium]